MFYFFLFLVILSTFLIIPEVKEKIKVKLPVATPTWTPITVVEEIIDTSTLIADKTIKFLSM